MKKGVGEGVLNLFEEEVWRKGLGRKGGRRKKNGCIFNPTTPFFSTSLVWTFLNLRACIA